MHAGLLYSSYIISRDVYSGEYLSDWHITSAHSNADELFSFLSETSLQAQLQQYTDLKT